MKGRIKVSTILILGLLSSIGPLSIDMYLPGFPSIARDLNTTVAKVSLSLSSFFIGISVGQFMYGPLLDRYGRKNPLYAGLTVYLLTSIGCALVTSVDALIGLRLLQALGGCVGMVASRALVRDLFPVNENARVFSLLMLVVGVSPIIAPTLGGYLTAAFGWHSVFVILSFLAVFILVAVHFTLPEGREPDPAFSLRPGFITRSFLSVLREPQFYTYAFTGSIGSAGLYAYIAGSPYVFMEIFGATERQYGWIFALIAAGLITASQLNSLLLRKYSSEQIIRVALFCQATTSVAIFAGSYMGVLNITTTIGLCFLFLSCQGFTFPNTSALSLAPFAKTAGSASALLGGIQMGIGACTSALVSIFSNHTAIPMTSIMAACAVSACLILFMGRKMIVKEATVHAVEEEAIEMASTS
jgi:DHA1 family bicyclomycin/chloramphenicol resistance-like MFS transporter